MELMAYMGQTIGVDISPEVMINIAIGVGVIAGAVLLMVVRGR